MSDDRGLQVRLDAAEREMLAWKETALTELKSRQAMDVTLLAVRQERNLLRRERKALSLTIRQVVDDGADVNVLLDLLASLANPPREGEGLLTEYISD